MKHSARSFTYGALLLSAVLCGCSTLNNMRPSTKEAKERAQQVQVLQIKVMRYADQYVGLERQALNTFLSTLTNPEDRLNAQRWKLQQAQSAYTIASGPNAITNALDMVVLATLSRMVLDDTWVSERYGARARPVQDVYRSLESSAWQMLPGILTDVQITRLHEVIDQWRAEHPHVTAVAYIHFLDFASAVGAPSGGEQHTPGNLFALVGLNPLSGLDPAVQQIELTRQLAERSIYYAQRVPDLLDMQVELLTYQFAVMPETKAVLADVNRVSLIGSAADRLVRTLPEMLDTQREALLKDLMRTLNTQSAGVETLAVQLRATLQAGTDTANAVRGALDTAQKITSQFAPNPGAPPPPPSQQGPPFDPRQYTALLAQATLTAREINTLAQSGDSMLPIVRSATQDAAAHIVAVENHLFMLLVLLVFAAAAAALLAALAYRRLVPRVERPARS
jgi:hypothetical protein